MVLLSKVTGIWSAIRTIHQWISDNSWRICLGNNFYSFYDGSYQEFTCLSSELIPNRLSDTGIIYYPNHYLSGFVFGYESVINGIQFQFTAIGTVNWTGIII